MTVTELELSGTFLLQTTGQSDSRGEFARLFCAQSLAAAGVYFELSQMNQSINHKRGTVRGMHLQAAPHHEIKIVRCVRGSVFDVIVDLRPTSPTYRRWLSLELSASNRRAVYIPAGCAHGFQTLTQDAELLYLMSSPYVPESARGYRFDDPSFGIHWPLAVAQISERDLSYAPYIEEIQQ